MTLWFVLCKQNKNNNSELAQYITPMALAFLIMDDGSWVATYKSIRIATNCFTAEEVDLLRNILESKFGIQITKQLLSKKGGVIHLKTNIIFMLKLLLLLN